MNSLGKDSTLCLEWLCKFAHPSRIVSVFYQFLAEHPGDKLYMSYLKKRYPTVEFLIAGNSIELNQIQFGVYQSPLAVNYEYNSFDHEEFDRRKYTSELQKDLGLDFVCAGFSKYEGFARASRFYKEGLVTGDRIYPLGLMDKKQVYTLLKETCLKLHPSYKFCKSTFDQPSYWKMRAAFIANPEYKKTMFHWFPLMRLDEYRFERLLLNGKSS